MNLTNKRIRDALDIVRAENPAESFREGVRQSIEFALENGLETGEDVRDLVVQICYRAADLGFLLDREDASLSDYSEQLRDMPDDGQISVDLPDPDDMDDETNR